MNDLSIRIRRADFSDIPSVVETHKVSFPGFFLTKLGSRFLGEMYSGYLTHPSGILLVALEGKDVVGFVSGTTLPDLFFSQLRRKRALYFLVYSFPALLRNPLIVFKKLFSAIFYRGDKPTELSNGALLSSIGVLPKVQGKSVGKNLLKCFEEEVFSRGIDFVYLTTDKLNNEQVNQFYRKNDYSVESSFFQNSVRPMLRYTKKNYREDKIERN